MHIARRVRCALLVSLSFIACLGVQRALAQDDRYWRQTYGTEATLLNGAVIGRATDVGTVFYNPAGLADVEHPSILLSGHVYEYEKIAAVGTSPVTGEPYAAVGGSIRPAPSFFGGTIPWKALGRHRLGYSVLTRQKGDVRNAFRVAVQLEDDLAQLEFLGTQDLNEVWVAPTWAWKATERLSVGASMFVAVRTHYQRSQITGQSLSDADEVGQLSAIREFDYDSWRIVPKLGATLDLRPVTLGLSVTVPSLGLWGSGSALFNSTSNNIDLDADGAVDATFASNFQEEVQSNFKSGLAVGLGAGIDVGANTTLFLSGEWYDAVGPYDVLSTTPFTGQLDGVERTNPLVHSARSVANFAAGVRHRFSPSVAGYLSGASDLSAADTSYAVSVSKTLWDLYHVGGGVQLRVRLVELVLGAAYTFGSEAVDVSGPPQAPGLVSDPITFKQKGIRFIFGFQYSFRGSGGESAPVDGP
jgi:hypothetical protein